MVYNPEKLEITYFDSYGNHYEKEENFNNLNKNID